MLNGAQSAIDNFRLPNKQQPDGAPRWARTDQTIALWDYATTDQLQGDGSAPLNVYFRIPPDIFYSERRTPRYGCVSLQFHTHRADSSMQVRINNAFLGSVPLIPGQEASRKMQVDVPVPVVNLRPFSNSLSFDFTFQLLKKGGCQDTTPINMQAAICATRTSICADIRTTRRFRTWRPLPMRVSHSRGWPTGGDDSSAAGAPTEQEIETFVTLMGHFSRQTDSRHCV